MFCKSIRAVPERISLFLEESFHIIGVDKINYVGLIYEKWC